MPEQAHGIDQQEQDEIGRIAVDYFQKTLGSEKLVQKALTGLVHSVKEDGAKLVHLGNVLFLVLVRGKGVVEVHTIGFEKVPRALAEDFRQLVAYLKNIGVKTAYTYSNDSRFSRIAQLTGLPVKTFPAKIEGEKQTVYVMEL